MSLAPKSNYTRKQKRMAAHIQDSYEDQGYVTEDAESIAWATMNKHKSKA